MCSQRGAYTPVGTARDEDEGGYYQRRCFVRETYDGPVRICR